MAIGSVQAQAAIDTHRANRIPLWLKLVYTAFAVVLVPVYWVNYGPANFLYFCDVALLMAVVAIWKEDKLLASIPTVGIFLPQMVWVADFFAHFGGTSVNGMTDYMFDATKSQFLRGLSLFHGWLPFLLLYIVWRLGYDRRALAIWIALAWALMLVCYFFMPGPTPDPGGRAVNINYVHGMSDTEPQRWMHPVAWLLLMMTVLPVLLNAPMHWLLCRIIPDRK